MICVPKITAIDQSLIFADNFIAKLKENTFEKILKEICTKFEC